MNITCTYHKSFLSSLPVLVGFVLLNHKFSVSCFVYHCCLLGIFLLVFVLSVLLRFIASDYSFGIFKLLSRIKIK